MRAYKQNAGDTVVGRIWRISDAGGVTSISVLTLAAAGAWTTTSSGVLAETTTGQPYTFFIYMNGVAATLDARFTWAKVTYTMADFGETL